jgi:hypothetical protein
VITVIAVITVIPFEAYCKEACKGLIGSPPQRSELDTAGFSC